MADFFESYLSIRQHVLIRFGKWREIIAQPLPADPELYCNTTAMMHYAKGVAHAALGEVTARKRSRPCSARPPGACRSRETCTSSPAIQLLAVAEEMLEGEIAYRRGEHDAAFAHLRAAVAMEDDLPYDEPWGWMQPVRHALGALLLEQGRVAEAEAVYREDLGLGGACPRPDPSGQSLGVARPAGLPGGGAARRGGRPDPPAPRLRRRPRRHAGLGILFLRPQQRRLSAPRDG